MKYKEQKQEEKRREGKRLPPLSGANSFENDIESTSGSIHGNHT
jgi:hypothetical protein